MEEIDKISVYKKFIFLVEGESKQLKKDIDKAVMMSDIKEVEWCDGEKIGIRDNNTLNTGVGEGLSEEIKFDLVDKNQDDSSLLRQGRMLQAE